MSIKNAQILKHEKTKRDTEIRLLECMLRHFNNMHDLITASNLAGTASLKVGFHSDMQPAAPNALYALCPFVCCLDAECKCTDGT